VQSELRRPRTHSLVHTHGPANERVPAMKLRAANAPGCTASDCMRMGAAPVGASLFQCRDSNNGLSTWRGAALWMAPGLLSMSESASRSCAWRSTGMAAAISMVCWSSSAPSLHSQTTRHSLYLPCTSTHWRFRGAHRMAGATLTQPPVTRVEALDVDLRGSPRPRCRKQPGDGDGTPCSNRCHRHGRTAEAGAGHSQVRWPGRNALQRGDSLPRSRATDADGSGVVVAQ
jgi:hypothetical protein